MSFYPTDVWTFQIDLFLDLTIICGHTSVCLGHANVRLTYTRFWPKSWAVRFERERLPSSLSVFFTFNLYMIIAELHASGIFIVPCNYNIVFRLVSISDFGRILIFLRVAALARNEGWKMVLSAGVLETNNGAVGSSLCRGEAWLQRRRTINKSSNKKWVLGVDKYICRSTQILWRRTSLLGIG